MERAANDFLTSFFVFVLSWELEKTKVVLLLPFFLSYIDIYKKQTRHINNTWILERTIYKRLRVFPELYVNLFVICTKMVVNQSLTTTISSSACDTYESSSTPTCIFGYCLNSTCICLPGIVDDKVLGRYSNCTEMTKSCQRLPAHVTTQVHGDDKAVQSS